MRHLLYKSLILSACTLLNSCQNSVSETPSEAEKNLRKNLISCEDISTWQNIAKQPEFDMPFAYQELLRDAGDFVIDHYQAVEDSLYNYSQVSGYIVSAQNDTIAKVVKTRGVFINPFPDNYTAYSKDISTLYMWKNNENDVVYQNVITNLYRLDGSVDMFQECQTLKMK